MLCLAYLLIRLVLSSVLCLVYLLVTGSVIAVAYATAIGVIGRLVNIVLLT